MIEEEKVGRTAQENQFRESAVSAGSGLETDIESYEREIETIDGDCSVARGFRFSGVHCGIKKSRLDLGLMVADVDCAIAGVFTTNRVQAAPVRYCREFLSGGRGRAIVVNSGNANACTGERGMADAREMAQLVAAELDCDAQHVFVCSTGVIGRPMPMEAVRRGVPLAVGELSSDPAAGDRVAMSIMTTDTCKKVSARRVELSSGVVFIGGMAKGSGMIAPEMVGPHATTLGFLATDVVLDAPFLQRELEGAMDESFNCVTVDGDTSTNDTVLLMASGASGVSLITDRDRQLFRAALREVSLDLALQVVRDGEGAQRVIEVRVSGASSNEAARRVARTVAESPLVKTAFCAGEPNWGRFLMAVGRSGVDLEEELIAIDVNELSVVRGGMGTAHAPSDLRAEMTRDQVLLAIDLGDPAGGEGRCFTCDLTEEYVRINGQYLT